VVLDAASSPSRPEDYHRAVHWGGRLVVCGAVLVTSAGACQQDWEGPLPPPDDVGAEPLPVGAVVGGVDAVYATLTDTTRLSEDGRRYERRCYFLLRLRPDGVAETSDACTTTDDVGAIAAGAEPWTRTLSTGDYAYRDGALYTRLVDWDVIAEELHVSTRETAYCVDGLYGLTYSGAVGVTAPLVAGAGPPDAARCD
jgi:hypothetical protein